MSENLRPGEKVYSYSSVGKQIVTVLEVGLTISTPLTPEPTPNMVRVEYPNGGTGFAHPKQLERLEIE
jgi:hypothetical protein